MGFQAYELSSGAGARAREVQVTRDELIVGLVDGRTTSVPLTWFPRLLHAWTEAEIEEVGVVGERGGVLREVGGGGSGGSGVAFGGK